MHSYVRQEGVSPRQLARHWLCLDLSPVSLDSVNLMKTVIPYGSRIPSLLVCAKCVVCQIPTFSFPLFGHRLWLVFPLLSSASFTWPKFQAASGRRRRKYTRGGDREHWPAHPLPSPHHHHLPSATQVIPGLAGCSFTGVVISRDWDPSNQPTLPNKTRQR